MGILARGMGRVMVAGVIGVCAWGGVVVRAEPPKESEAAEVVGAAKVRAEAEKVRPLVKTELARKFLDAAAVLPEPGAVKLYLNRAQRKWLSAEEYEKLPVEQREGFELREFDASFYYDTKYGSPVAYARTLDLIPGCGAAPAIESLAGKKIMDIGAGSMGQLRMMSAAGGGAEAVGVDVDPLLTILYRGEKDQGEMPTLDKGGRGTARMVIGFWPGDEATKKSVGDGYDLILSKNTLKAGYLHPSKPADPRTQLKLGVSDEEYVKALFESLKPAGVVMIYNICPAPSKEGEPFVPWAEGKCPFPREMWEKTGFRVVKFDEIDDVAVREMFEALGYPVKKKDSGEDDIFAWYSVFQKK
ncbi:MAG TPA: hypothetical protein VG797_11310 [Phycisphaerales bacterium]|nr:hypothetical protein [Phycisphaerales bacterium]